MPRRQPDADDDISPIAELIRTRPEAFDFGDCPDTEPLSEEYKADMEALRLLRVSDSQRRTKRD